MGRISGPSVAALAGAFLLVGIGAARADFFDDVRRTFQKDIPRTFERDIPRAFGATPKKDSDYLDKPGKPPPAPRRQ